MTDIEQKALALVNEVAAERGYGTMEIDPKIFHAHEALCRAIEQHEAFRQQVSDALEKRGFYIDDRDLGRFIIAKPDPLVEAMQEWWDADGYANIETFRAAIEKRGGKIVWGEG